MNSGHLSQKTIHQCLSQEREAGDCWIGLSLANTSGLIVSARVGKHTDTLTEQLVMNTEGKTNCKQFNSDGWGGYERVLPPEVQHHIGKDKTSALRAHQRDCSTTHWTLASTAEHESCGRNPSPRNSRKFGKLWEQTKVITRLVVSYFNWIWRHSRLKSTAAQRAGLATHSWNWHDIAVYPTLS